MSDHAHVVSFGESVSPWVSFNDAPAVTVREDHAETLAAMRRELEGVETRLRHLPNPPLARPLDALQVQQTRAELEDYRDAVKAQIRAQQALVRELGAHTRLRNAGR